MTAPASREALSSLFVAACEAELRALKPGNVHVHGAGHGMDTSHFEAAARAAAPHVADPDLRIGERIERAVNASLAAAGLNTNLGILLLCAPLAKAAQTAPPAGEANGFRRKLSLILGALDRDDATAVFRAIVRANPAGLGTTAVADVNRPADVTLREAMALAQDRDRIARAYVTDFEDIFSFGLPTLFAARAEADSEDDAITTLHLSYLAMFPDSHIARKHGTASARQVCADAKRLAVFWQPVVRPDSHPRLLDFDRDLKARGLNPGTTADLVVATLYAAGLITQDAASRAA